MPRKTTSDRPDLAEIRVNTTKSRFAAGLNRLLQQNRAQTDMALGSVDSRDSQ